VDKKDLEDQWQIDVSYTDFEKAFDKMPQRHVIGKLESYGIIQFIQILSSGLKLSPLLESGKYK